MSNLISSTRAASANGTRADLFGHILLGAGAILHSIGGGILRNRNDELTDALAGAHAVIEDLRKQLDGAPAPDVDEHQGEHVETAAAPSAEQTGWYKAAQERITAAAAAEPVDELAAKA